MGNILFSIIVPVYNVYEYLTDCLDSLVRLIGLNYEIIIVNDGSTDDSELICKEYADKYGTIKYFYKENGGLSSARNYGISKAIGEYVLFIDSDDFLLHDDFLVKISNILESVEADLLMYLPVEFNSDRTEIVKRHNVGGYVKNRVIRADEIVDGLYASINPYITMAQTKVIKRDYLTDNGLFFEDNIYHEDDEWIARLLLANPKVFLTDLEEYGYRHRLGSIITSTDNSKQVKRCWDCIKIASGILSKKNIFEHKQCVTYFISYYLIAVGELCKRDEQSDNYVADAKYDAVFSSLKYSLCKRHRLLYIYMKLFGIKAAKKFIVKRFSKGNHN